MRTYSKGTRLRISVRIVTDFDSMEVGHIVTICGDKIRIPGTIHDEYGYYTSGWLHVATPMLVNTHWLDMCELLYEFNEYCKLLNK